MARKRRRSKETESTMFPFISLLLCTMGAMILVWMSFSLTTTITNPHISVDIAAIEQESESLTQAMSKGHAQLASLADLRTSVAKKTASLDNDLSARQQELTNVRNRLRDLQEQMAIFGSKYEAARLAEGKLDDLRRRMAAAKLLISLQADEQAVQAQLNALTAKLQALDQRKDELDRKRAEDSSIAKTLEALGTEGQVEWRTTSENPLIPILVEVVGDGIRMLPAAATAAPLSVTEAMAPGGQLRAAADKTADGRTCLALLVRPDGIVVARGLAQTLHELHAVYTTEPVDRNWNLATMVAQSPQATP